MSLLGEAIMPFSFAAAQAYMICPDSLQCIFDAPVPFLEKLTIVSIPFVSTWIRSCLHSFNQPESSVLIASKGAVVGSVTDHVGTLSTSDVSSDLDVLVEYSGSYVQVPQESGV
ncbi:hypothetical protein K435DRAFT_865722 [Dendrothele bispora CBS 962.96]|uniref:Uncharacterized protein n=1 Tax=Dendrothele bispora (strain CBS 962.96) TaxID=1314807 RepID=A0A4S8LJ37_DENBC|nr:hypothetical protein K435DRAFT_865722 [Dendrothele bispora CBS 962.96]